MLLPAEGRDDNSTVATLLAPLGCNGPNENAARPAGSLLTADALSTIHYIRKWQGDESRGTSPGGRPCRADTIRLTIRTHHTILGMRNDENGREGFVVQCGSATAKGFRAPDTGSKGCPEVFGPGTLITEPRSCRDRSLPEKRVSAGQQSCRSSPRGIQFLGSPRLSQRQFCS